jgi:hypothetical protein
MVAGIVLFALGLKTTLAHVDEPLPLVPALGLCGGIALYLMAHTVTRLRIGSGWGHGRPVATILLIGLLPLVGRISALSALACVAGVCAGLIAYEAIRYREARAWIRSRRGAFTMEESDQLARPSGWPRRRSE